MSASRDVTQNGYSRERTFLYQRHLEMIKASAISADVSRERGYRTCQSPKNLKSNGFAKSQCRTPGLLIPLYNVRGEPAGYQFRPDKRRMREGKAVKYETPRGQRMVVDCPPRCRPALGDPNIPLFITEGPRKGDAAASLGLCCVALLGVWNWRGKNDAGGTTALADWEDIALKGRVVCLVFDSDVMIKAQVAQARERLGGFLKSRGAIVKVIPLPASDSADAKVGLDDFIAAQKEAGKTDEEIRQVLLPSSNGGQADETSDEHSVVNNTYYRETRGGLVRLGSSKGRLYEVPLTNFTARIIANISRDDGAETSHAFEIEACLFGRTRRFIVPAMRFAGMRWAVEELGSDAVVYAGIGTADHARTAIQLHSKGAAPRTIFTHTGWRKVDGRWIYLHCGGALDGDGAVGGVEVDLPPELAAFNLESRGDAVEAVRKSMRLLNLAPDPITVPLYGAIWRAILSGADFSVFLYGHTGVFKTALSALVQQHFGADFSADNLPANFTSTANANELLGFICKDAILVVDELHPPASGSEHDRMYRDAARLLRAQGNRAGRERLRADGTLRPAKPPRCLMVATGEDLARGQSLQARLLILEVCEGDVARDKLSACQLDAASGAYQQAVAAFVRWLAPRLDNVRAGFEELRREVRAQVQHDHPRTAEVRAELTAAYSIFARFLLDVGAIVEGEAEDFQNRIGAALEETANAQARYSASEEPTAAYLRLLSSAFAAGHAHLADRWGGPPEERESAAGWRRIMIAGGKAWQPQGDRVGWIDDRDVYLERDASYGAARKMSTDGAGIEVTVNTLSRRLRDKGLLASVDSARETLTIRRVLDGMQRDVLHLRAQTLNLTAPQPDKPDSSTSAQPLTEGRMAD
jgi:hypothetical protein